MKLPRHGLLLLSLGSTLLVAGAAAAAEKPATIGRVVRSCGTPDPSPAERAQVRMAVGRYFDEFGGRPVGGQIRVAFHVLSDGAEGDVPLSQLQAQIDVLNRDYRGTGYSFVLASVDRTRSKKFFTMGPGNGKETDAKRTLAIDPAHRLNVYTAKPGQNLLGWAYFPQSFPESDFHHGVVIHYGSLPGGPIAHYNLGKTLTHEVGHYLGLYHTFQGGCSEPGDEVGDTPFEASPNFGCPGVRNTCPQPGNDPIENYMDYSDDACLTTFTGGQDARMDAIVPVYRPSLLNAAIAQNARGPEIEPASSLPASVDGGIQFRGAAPNPFRNETAIRFALPQSDRVELKVYNITGQLVETLIDGVMPAGEHGIMFSGRGLPAGMYFTRLRVGKTNYSRSVVLIR